MARDADWLVDWAGELDNLVIAASIDVPKSDGGIVTNSDDVAFCKVEVHAQNGICVRPEHSLILLVCLVKNTKTSI